MPVQQNSFTHLRVLLVLTDRGILAQSNWRRRWAELSMTILVGIRYDRYFVSAFRTAVFTSLPFLASGNNRAPCVGMTCLIDQARTSLRKLRDNTGLL